jgi:hypothetical protein
MGAINETLTDSARSDAPAHEIGDARFVGQMYLLRDLRAYLLYNGVRIENSQAGELHLGALSHFCYKKGAPLPTVAQYDMMDHALESLFALLSEKSRKTFMLAQFPPWVPRLAIACLLAAVGCLGIATIWQDVRYVPLLAYVGWLALTGALGSMSFIAMNVLSVQDDITFDLSSNRLLAIRVIIGSLFGVVLGLPFGNDVFVMFTRHLGVALPVKTAAADASYQAMFLLLPFVCGFSTTLGILLLNRLVDAVHTLFGEPAERRAAEHNVSEHKRETFR